jgi:hypothetical protein
MRASVLPLLVFSSLDMTDSISFVHTAYSRKVFRLFAVMDSDARSVDSPGDGIASNKRSHFSSFFGHF